MSLRNRLVLCVSALWLVVTGLCELTSTLPNDGSRK
jgi:hypothetical protein